MRILLLVSAFNGLSQRTWCALREAGHDVGVLLATGAPAIIDGVRAAQPDLILCPFLKDRVPAEVWQHHRTVIIHPGPVGDRGPSSLDWAISEGVPTWGVTALQAVEEMDAGPIWASRTFAMPSPSMRKSALYNGPVADAALECVREVVRKAADPSFVPTPAEQAHREVPGARERPLMRQSDRSFDWADPTEEIVRRIRAADGAPGVRTRIGGRDVFAYDAHPGPARTVTPGTLLQRHEDAVLVATGDGSVLIGHLRLAEDGSHLKLPAAELLPAVDLLPAADLVPSAVAGSDAGLHRQVRYRRDGHIGWVEFDFYNGAMAPAHCARLLAAIRHAIAQDTSVLVLLSGTEAFSNGIHLTVIDAAPDPAAAAWANIRAINEVCREIIGCADKTIIAGYAGSAGAGGVMLGLGADIVAVRAGTVLNPHYDMGLYGSELHTLTLPRRVGADRARTLLDERLPISAEQAHRIGLADEIGPREPASYRRWIADLAGRRRSVAPAAARAGMPPEAYEARELAQMSHDMFDDRSGFAAARRVFVTKTRATSTPLRLRLTSSHQRPVPAGVV